MKLFLIDRGSGELVEFDSESKLKDHIKKLVEDDGGPTGVGDPEDFMFDITVIRGDALNVDLSFTTEVNITTE